MLFVSHLVLVLSIILGMTYSRYNNEWDIRVEQRVSVARSQFTSQLTYFSTAVAGRNYAHLMMPTTKEVVWGIQDLVFIEVSGTSDYQNRKFGVRYLKDKKLVWRTDVTQEELESLSEKKRVLIRQKQQTPAESKVRLKKLDYLINKRNKDIAALTESIELHQSNDLLWLMPSELSSGYVLDELHDVLHIKVDLINRNGGQIWAVFDARDLESMKMELLLDLAKEASIATLISLVLIYGVTIWIVSPLKALATSMKEDIEHINIRSLPEIRRNDEIGELARSYSGLITKIRNQLKVLKKLSDTDPLTGLGSRYKYNHESELFLESALSSENHACVLICDIDNFKAYNDTYGHTEGDNTLCSVAEAIECSLGNKGIAYRFGGEEFVVLAEGSTPDLLKHLVHRVHKSTEALAIPHAGNPPFDVVTISVGAVIIPTAARRHIDDNYDEVLSEALRAADKKLYVSKNKGRNLVEFCDFTLNAD